MRYQVIQNENDLSIGAETRYLSVAGFTMAYAATEFCKAIRAALVFDCFSGSIVYHTPNPIMAITQNNTVIVPNVNGFHIVETLRQLPDGDYHLESAPGWSVATYFVKSGTVRRIA
jgi:hypothetical protein